MTENFNFFDSRQSLSALRKRLLWTTYNGQQKKKFTDGSKFSRMEQNVIIKSMCNITFALSKHIKCTMGMIVHDSETKIREMVKSPICENYTLIFTTYT